MNERIRELAKEAGIFYYRRGKSQEDMEKFAELLLVKYKEVILTMMNNGHGDSDTLDQVLTEINEHFGVENV